MKEPKDREVKGRAEDEEEKKITSRWENTETHIYTYRVTGGKKVDNIVVKMCNVIADVKSGGFVP